MPQSKIVSPMHFVWSTHERLPLIVPEIERSLYRCLTAEAQALRCEVLAIGGMPDHVHIAVLFPAMLTYSQFAKQLKGASSKRMKDVLSPDSYFYWSDGYGAFGFARSQIDTVVSYIRRQKEHHTNHQLWPTLEQTHEPPPAPSPSTGRPAAKPSSCE